MRLKDLIEYCSHHSSCSECPYRTDVDCITSLFREIIEHHIAEHPEIFDGNKTLHDE